MGDSTFVRWRRVFSIFLFSYFNINILIELMMWKLGVFLLDASVKLLCTDSAWQLISNNNIIMSLYNNVTHILMSPFLIYMGKRGDRLG